MRIIPNRIIKESIRESKAISSLTDAQFRLWLYLITYVDDYGRGKADPELLASILFPRIKSFSEKQVKDCMDGLERKGLIVRYVADQEPYFFFPNWAKHQRIQTKKSKFPPPPDDLVIHGESRWNSVNDGDSPSESNPIQYNPNPNPNPNTNPNPKTDVFEAFASGDDSLSEALRSFEEMRKQIKKPLSNKAKNLLLNKLQTFPKEQWIPILEQSIMNSWQGIFPLEKQKEVLPF